MERTSTIAVVSFALAATACGVAPAPKDIDSLSRWFWLNQKSATDTALIQGMQHLDAAAGSLSDPTEQTISRLQKGDALAAGATFEGDVTKAAGLLLINIIHCPIARVEQLLVQADQKSLHSNYITYTRTFGGSLPDYLARKTLTVDWTSTYQLSLLGWVFQPDVPGGSRFVAAASTGPAPHGPVVAALAWFNGPAMSVGAANGDYYKQNYQVQIFYERSPGVVVHLYAIWEELSVNGLTSDNTDIVQPLTLGSLKGSDNDYETHCSD